MFEKALVPLDGSELAEGILPYVSQLMKGVDGSITLLSVIDPDAVELPVRLRHIPAATHARYVGRGGAGTHPHESGEPHVTQIFDRLHEEAKRRLDEVAQELTDYGVHAESVIAFGHPAETIADIAEKKGCDLIAMSTHGRDPLVRGVLGSVTDKIIHLTHRPTLTITPDRAKQYGDSGDAVTNIMVPLDGSSLAESVLPYVEFLAQQLSLDIVLVRVLKIVKDVTTLLAPGEPYFGAGDLEEEIEAEATEYLEAVAERLKAKSLKVEWKLLKGHPAVVIVDLARETPHDIIALASHGRSGHTRWLMGSVADTLVRVSGDPVLVVPTNVEA